VFFFSDGCTVAWNVGEADLERIRATLLRAVERNGYLEPLRETAQEEVNYGYGRCVAIT
jgi:uncharacterized Rmd1/YagE family protein